jgi:hypothetical protein
MSNISLRLRVDTKAAWDSAQSDPLPKGNLSKGELAAAIENENKIIVRVGTHDTPIPFNNCPIVFQSSLDYVSEQVKIAILNNLPIFDAYIVWENNNFSFKLFSEFLSQSNYPENFIEIPVELLDNGVFLYWNNDTQQWEVRTQIISQINPEFFWSNLGIFGGGAEVILPPDYSEIDLSQRE